MDPTPRLFADRSDRGKLAFTGPQARWFLHQILTQAFEDLGPGEARDAALITAHGRMVGYLECLGTDEGVLAHLEPELHDTLPDAIRRYVFATQVEIEDVTRSMGLVLVTGDGWGDVGARVPGARRHETSSLGVPAGYLWLAREEVPGALEALAGEGWAPATEEDLEELRIRNGAPRWGREMDVRSFPQEAGIDRRAVHYDKGCYVGQEAMAKIHFRGKVNRRVARLAGAGRLTAGADVMVDGSPVGRVTSAAGSHALATVKHDVPAGARVIAGGVEAEVADAL
ncbi:MAG: folate-binding protein YgfZ [Actinomycetota bacterium]